MEKISRTGRFIINAKVSAIFYFCNVVVAFFSRKLFLDILGTDFIGLTGTILNVLGLLNLAELGVGASISYVLYSPLKNKERDKVREIVSILGYLYRIIGLAILIVGIVVALFLPLIFSKENIPISLVLFSYFVFLIISFLSYFVNYKQILLTADQRNYTVTTIFQGIQIVKVIIQCFVLWMGFGVVFWLIIELSAGVSIAILLDRRVKKIYPYLSECSDNGKDLLSKFPEIIRSTKQILVHKFAGVVLTQTDQILIFSFANLTAVATYGNYLIIVNKVSEFFLQTVNSISASVGNLVAEGDKSKILNVFWELVIIRHFIAGFVVFVLMFTVEPFIALWVGDRFIMDSWILYVTLANVFILQIRGTFDNFLHSYGLFRDVWAPLSEALLNLILSLLLAHYYGIVGILIGTFISTFLVVCCWKPFFLFRKGLKLKYQLFFEKQILVFFANILSIVLAWIVFSNFRNSLFVHNAYITFVVLSIVVVLIYLFCSLFVFYFLLSDFRVLVIERIKSIIKR